MPMTIDLKKIALALLVVLTLYVLMTQTAFAATTGSEFSDLYDLLRSWASGSLGKAIAIAFLLVGLGVGVIRGSIVAAVACIAAAVSLLMAPGIIDAMFTTG